MVVEVKNLSRNFGAFKAVDDLSFSISSGEVIGFVGPNGAGKTTTMRIMATLDCPSSGDVFIDGASILDCPFEARRQIGFMPDTLPEYDNMTVFEYLDFFGRAFRLTGRGLSKNICEVVEFTGVGNLKDKLLRTLSKGMKQRVSLARALIHNPGILILDEPANGLDPRARVELRELVVALGASGKAVLVSSHILSELSEMCTGYQIIEKGRILKGGTLDDISQRNDDKTTVVLRALETPPSEIIASLVECTNVCRCCEEGPRVRLIIKGGEGEAAELLTMLLEKKIRLVEFSIQKDNLEDVFMTITNGDI